MVHVQQQQWRATLGNKFKSQHHRLMERWTGVGNGGMNAAPDQETCCFIRTSQGYQMGATNTLIISFSFLPLLSPSSPFLSHPYSPILCSPPPPPLISCLRDLVSSCNSTLLLMETICSGYFVIYPVRTYLGCGRTCRCLWPVRKNNRNGGMEQQREGTLRGSLLCRAGGSGSELASDRTRSGLLRPERRQRWIYRHHRSWGHYYFLLNERGV